jgi:hypothetical protein
MIIVWPFYNLLLRNSSLFREICFDYDYMIALGIFTASLFVRIKVSNRHKRHLLPGVYSRLFFETKYFY